MAQIVYPKDQDGLLALGETILAQAPKAAKAHRARLPASHLSSIRKNHKAAKKDVALARKLRRDAEQATARAGKALEAMAKAARGGAQVLKELLPDIKDLGAYGYQVDEVAPAAPVATPQA